MAEEHRRERHSLRRRAIGKKELLEVFRRRRLHNYNAEANLTGATRPRPVPPPSQKEPRRQRRTEPPKDWAFYKRDGFVWSDLGRIPRERLSLVVPPIAIKRDLDCIEWLLSKVEKEEADAQEEKRLQLERVATERGRRLAKAALRKTRQAHVEALGSRSTIKGRSPAGIPSEKRTPTSAPTDSEVTPSTAAPCAVDKTGRRANLSQRQEKLARPRQPANRLRSYVMSGNTDLTGLLHANSALRGILDYHLDDVRKELTAARFAKRRAAIPQHEQGRGYATVSEESEGDRACEKSPQQQQQQQQQQQRQRIIGSRQSETLERAARWPYISAEVQQVASVEFDPRATLGDEESQTSELSYP